MAQRRPITTHPAFVPLLAVWFAALFGLGVAVLPAAILGSVLGSAGLGGLMPPTGMSRVIASVGAALIGATVGFLIARPLARSGQADPRPVYAEPEPEIGHPAAFEPARRPLRVREELAEDLPEPAAETEAGPPGPGPVAAAAPELAGVDSEEGFMILTPQPVHPPRPAPDLDSLLAQFDTALAAFRSGDEPSASRAAAGPDPVRAFVARQTGTPAPSPLGGRMPDHQAELRAALDKLARAHRKD